MSMSALTIQMPIESSPPLWSEALLLGLAAVDDEHERLAWLIERMQRASASDMAQTLEAVLTHATSHFEAENELMLATQFPPRDCHIREHDAVLSTLRGVLRRMDCTGEVSVAYRLADELAAWFPAHVQHLDSALSHWLCKLQHGAKPIVLRKVRKSETALAT